MSAVPIYVGVWIDWSYGPVLGLSLTVPETYGRYIVSATSTFINVFVTDGAWSLISYCVHQCSGRVSQKVPWGLVYQQNVALRNGQSGGSALKELFWLAWTWSPLCIFSCSCRKKSDKKRKRTQNRRCYCSTWRQTIAIGIWPAFVAGAFPAIATVSAKVAKPIQHQDDVRIKYTTEACGVWVFDTSTEAGQAAHDTKVLNDTIAGRAYARSCYAKDISSLNTITCSFFTTPMLKYQTALLGRSCPFGLSQSAQNLELPYEGGECDVPENNGSFLMYTNILDSQADMGINAAPQDRVQFQKNVTCSPLAIHSTASMGPFTSGNYTAFEYGPISGVSAYTYLYNPGAIRDIVGYQIT